jgi:FkbM family methyltransferase
MWVVFPLGIIEMSTNTLARELVERALALAGVRLERLDKPIHRHQEKFGQLILDEQRRKAGEDFFFVQVGACDGISFDALYDFVVKHQLPGIVIEPLPDLYRELKANYSRCLSIIPLNVALHRTAKQVEMYRISPEAKGLPGWTKGMSSMDPEHHKLYNVSSNDIITEVVPCISWAELVGQQRISRIDYLQLDTEGYDYEIIEMVDFERLRPAIIKFEHDIPSRTTTTKRFANCISRLIEHNYHILTMPREAIAYSHLAVNPPAD